MKLMVDSFWLCMLAISAYIFYWLIKIENILLFSWCNHFTVSWTVSDTTLAWWNHYLTKLKCINSCQMSTFYHRRCIVVAKLVWLNGNIFIRKLQTYLLYSGLDCNHILQSYITNNNYISISNYIVTYNLDIIRCFNQYFPLYFKWTYSRKSLIYSMILLFPSSLNSKRIFFTFRNFPFKDVVLFNKCLINKQI